MHMYKLYSYTVYRLYTLYCGWGRVKEGVKSKPIKRNGALFVHIKLLN